jgi:hypothetical protein
VVIYLMADVIVAAPGQINGTGDRLAQWLKIFGGEVITAFSRASKTEGRHMLRTITAGKSAAFPVLGRATAAYLKPGGSLDDIRTNIPGTEVVINIDGLLTASAMITDIDDAMSHFEVSGEYSKQLGEALAYSADGAVLAELAKLVVADTENLTGLGAPKITAKVGSTGTPLTSATLGQLYLDALLEMQYNLDSNFVPETERTAYITPDVAAALVNAKIVIDSDYNSNSNGSIAEGSVMRVAGFDLVKVPGLTRGGASTTNILQGDGHVFPAAYTATCKIIAAHRSAVGTLKLMDLGMEHARRTEYQADMVVAKYAIGHKGLRPEAVMMTTLTLS